MFIKPSDHPKILNDKIGVLLINLGTPNNTDTKSIRIYLKEFLSDPRVIDLPRILWWLILNLIILNTRPKKTGAAYKKIWLMDDKDGSPLRKYTRLQSENLLKAFNNDKLITHRQLNGRDVTIPYFNLNNQQVWGATSMVLSEFKDMLHLI